MRRNALLLFLPLLLCLDATAGEILIPVVHRGEGVGGSVWRTAIVVSNISTDAPFPVLMTATLHRENAEPVVISTPLASNETLDVPDAVWNWFGLEQGGGVVRVTWSAPGELVAWARIYNVGSGGEFGQGIPGLAPDALRKETFLTGLSGVNGNRTNVGIANPHDTEIMVWVELYDTAGTSRGSFTYGVPARAYRQLDDIFSRFQAGPLHAATIRISSTSLPVYAYASVIRNDTGDPTFVPAY